MKVIPGARKEGVVGWLGDALKLKVNAPPERGKANAAVERLLARTLGVGAGDVEVVAGFASPRKRVVVRGLSEEDVRARIDAMNNG